MAKLIWSPTASLNLEEICDYIEKDSEHYAILFAQKIIALIEDIPDFPNVGRVVPEYNEGSPWLKPGVSSLPIHQFQQRNMSPY